MIFVLLFTFFCKKEADIKVKHTSVRLEILNRHLNSLNGNISKEVNVKARDIFLVTQQGGWGGFDIRGAMSSARQTEI